MLLSSFDIICLYLGLLKTATDPPDVPVEKLVMDVDGTDLPFQDNSVDIGRLTEQIYRLRIIQ